MSLFSRLKRTLSTTNGSNPNEPTASPRSGSSSIHSGGASPRRDAAWSSSSKPTATASKPPPSIFLNIDGLDDLDSFKPARAATKSTSTAGVPRISGPIEATSTDPAKAEAAERDRERVVLRRVGLTSGDVGELVERVGAKMKEGGLTTPSLFLPHCLPSSTDIQQTLLVLFLRHRRPELLPQPTEPALRSSLAPAPPSADYLFTTELRYTTASAHDLAAVVRYALRHRAPSAGASDWYTSLAVWEWERGYEPTAWAQLAGMDAPLVAMLASVCEVLSGLAACVGTTGVGAGKLARIVGFWTLRDGREKVDTLEDLLKVVERLGQRMEHLLLTYIRHQATLVHQLPGRLLPLIDSYPFAPRPSMRPTSDPYLPGPPPETPPTRQVLHVQLRASSLPKGRKTTSTMPGKLGPLALAEHAFGGLRSMKTEGDEPALAAWTEARARARGGSSSAGASPNGKDVAGGGASVGPTLVDLDEVLSGETLRTVRIAETFYITPVKKNVVKQDDGPMYRPFQMASPSSLSSHDRRRSMSFSAVDQLSSVQESQPASTSSEFGALPITPSWAEFSSIGFSSSSTALPTSPSFSNGLSIASLSSNSDAPPKRLSARSTELDRILKTSSSTGAGEPFPLGGSSSNNSAGGAGSSFESSRPSTPTKGAAATSTAEVERVSFLEIPEGFYELSQDTLLEPELESVFPNFSMYELREPIRSSSASSASTTTKWLLISVAPPPPAPSPSSTTVSSPTSAVPPRPIADGTGTTSSASSKRAKRTSFLGLSMGSIRRRGGISSSEIANSHPDVFEDTRANGLRAVSSPTSPPALGAVMEASSSEPTKPAVASPSSLGNASPPSTIRGTRSHLGSGAGSTSNLLGSLRSSMKRSGSSSALAVASNSGSGGRAKSPSSTVPSAMTQAPAPVIVRESVVSSPTLASATITAASVEVPIVDISAPKEEVDTVVASKGPVALDVIEASATPAAPTKSSPTTADALPAKAVDVLATEEPSHPASPTFSDRASILAHENSSTATAPTTPLPVSTTSVFESILSNTSAAPSISLSDRAEAKVVADERANGVVAESSAVSSSSLTAAEEVGAAAASSPALAPSEIGEIALPAAAEETVLVSNGISIEQPLTETVPELNTTASAAAATETTAVPELIPVLHSPDTESSLATAVTEDAYVASPKQPEPHAGRKVSPALAAYLARKAAETEDHGASPKVDDA